MKTSLFICLILLPPVLAIAQKADVMLKKADSLVNAKKNKEALTIYTTLIKADPKNEMALRGRAYLYAIANKFDDAEKDYKEALKLNPSCSNCWARLSILKLLKKDTAALSLAEKAVKADAKNPIAYVARARILAAEKKHTEAEADFKAALSVDSNNTDAFYHRAYMYISMENIEKAKNDFSSIITIDPHAATAYFELGIALANEQKFDEALRNFLMAIKEDSTQSNYYKVVGNVYYYRSEFDNALKYYAKAISLDPNDHEAYFFRSQVWHGLENMNACCNDLQKTLKSFPKDADDEALGIKNEAEGLLKEFCDSSQAGYYYQRGIAKFNLREYDKALMFYYRGLAKFPQHTMMISFKGNANFALGNYKEAESDYTQSLSLKNNLLTEIKQSWSHSSKDAMEQQQMVTSFLMDIYNHRAETRINLGNYPAARADVEEGLKLPGQISGRDYTYVLSGVLNITEGNNNAALSDLNKAIAINPNNAGAYANRAVTKMNLAFKTKIISYYTEIKGKGLNGKFNFPTNSKSTTNTDNLEAALTDCNKALQIDKDFAFAYYIRANIKMLLDQPDYCYDLLKAEQLGLIEASNLIKEKKCR